MDFLKSLDTIKNNKFNLIIAIIIIFTFVFMFIKDYSYIYSAPNKYKILNTYNEENLSKNLIKNKTVIIFTHPACKSCKKQKKYIDKTSKLKYPEVKFLYFNINTPKSFNLIKEYYIQYGINIENIRTPSTFIGNNYIIGYQNDEITGKKIDFLIKNNFYNHKVAQEKKQVKEINTFFGKIDLLKLSLPALAILLGLIDGFNPCAMWVLVYLISLIAELENKSKKWFIVGTFIFASGILYFLFITALLNVFLFIGYLRIIELLIGCFALYIGLVSFKNYFSRGNHIECKVTDYKTRKKTMGFAKRTINASNIITAVLGIILLAFAVNSIEFLCSAGLPAIFTSIISQANLSKFEYYLYIFLYVLFFMLDDLIIFSLAVFAIDKYIGEKYLTKTKLIAGIILTALGMLMIFFPNYLK